MAVTHNALNRYVQGVSNRAANHPLGLLTIPDRNEWTIFFDDFLTLPSVISGSTAIEAETADVEVGQWTVHMGADDDVDIAQRAAVANSAGVWNFANEGIIEGENVYMDLEGGPFQIDSGVPFILEVRFSAFSASTGEKAMFVGLADAGGDETTLFVPNGGSLQGNNMLGFAIFDTSNNIHAVTRIADSETRATTIATSGSTALRFNTLTIAYDGTTAQVFANGALQSTEFTTAQLPTVDLTPCMHMEDAASEAANAVTLDLDYILVAKHTPYADRAAVATS